MSKAQGSRKASPTVTSIETARAKGKSGTGGMHLREHVARTVRGYLDALEGELTTDVYQMVLAEVEAPLLAEVMAYTNNNQTRASDMLGLNRGTLRKKLKQYQLLEDRS